ncbi:hypothetical protein DFA_10729 [Cavenderia fasciculata]|uniref:Uncharacterized protein n=1 Tax=Cavenderia fasciculata TaxID=261658 RepID=F4QB84_CACFS|nr:uncharacterized protein DFA_10729 [Cavenderia fasciculata]EGG14856.1 hypothetical protein DFA_10729 [Cavenderia fasciculata]|eukprot:XP_004351372.1 hypothetical protein DFA_10729 [Cavenderia fasciculata]
MASSARILEFFKHAKLPIFGVLGVCTACYIHEDYQYNNMPLILNEDMLDDMGTFSSAIEAMHQISTNRLTGLQNDRFDMMLAHMAGKRRLPLGTSENIDRLLDLEAGAIPILEYYISHKTSMANEYHRASIRLSKTALSNHMLVGNGFDSDPRLDEIIKKRAHQSTYFAPRFEDFSLLVKSQVATPVVGFIYGLLRSGGKTAMGYRTSIATTALPFTLVGITEIADYIGFKAREMNGDTFSSRVFGTSITIFSLYPMLRAVQALRRFSPYLLGSWFSSILASGISIYAFDIGDMTNPPQHIYKSVPVLDAIGNSQIYSYGDHIPTKPNLFGNLTREQVFGEDEKENEENEENEEDNNKEEEEKEEDNQ